jgi:NAD(P)-dependent dehydrogenase (short-subunit alcohol dehydrogenase family)
MDIQSLYGVKGKTAVITGGASGLGEMMATAFVVNGGNVIIASRKEKALAKACEEMNKKGPGKASYIVGDISTKAGCLGVAEEVKKRVDKIHVLVNNSGVTWGAHYDNVPEKEGWDRVLAMNVKSIFYMTAALTDLLAKGANNIDPGRVIVISSVAGISPSAEETGLGGAGHGLWSYNASKAAAISLSNTLANTLSKKFITCNAICPGVYPSKMTAFGLQNNSAALAASHPMGRIGTPEDMAGLFLMLVSRAGSHITGNFIITDGGAMASGGAFGGSAEKPKL